MTTESCIVIAADKLCNVRSLIFAYRKNGEDLWERFSGEKSDILWYYRSISDSLGQVIPGALVDTLKSGVAEMERMVEDLIHLYCDRE